MHGEVIGMIRIDSGFSSSIEELTKEIRKNELTDIITLYSYFWVGASENLKYNIYYAQVLEAIGNVYGDSDNNSSNYKRGVTFISEKLHVSKSAVKVLRKNFKRYRKVTEYSWSEDFYEYKIPYTVVKIMAEIIKCLDSITLSEYFNSEFINKYKISKVSAVIEDIYDEIKNSAYGSKEEISIEIKNGLFNIDR